MLNLLQAQSSQRIRACLFHGGCIDGGFGGRSHLPYAHMASARTDRCQQKPMIDDTSLRFDLSSLAHYRPHPHDPRQQVNTTIPLGITIRISHRL